MYYIIENWKITDSSENYLSSENWTTIEKDFTQEELQKITSWYSYNINLWEFQESETSIEFEKQLIENKKKEILKQLWELKLILNWMIEVWDDITEITVKINTLISEYKSL